MILTSRRVFPLTGCDLRLQVSRLAMLLNFGVLRQAGGSTPGFCNLMLGVAAVISMSSVAPLFPGFARPARHLWRHRQHLQVSKSPWGQRKRKPSVLVKAVDYVDGGSGVVALPHRGSPPTTRRRKALLQFQMRRSTTMPLRIAAMIWSRMTDLSLTEQSGVATVPALRQSLRHPCSDRQSAVTAGSRTTKVGVVIEHAEIAAAEAAPFHRGR